MHLRLLRGGAGATGAGRTSRARVAGLTAALCLRTSWKPQVSSHPLSGSDIHQKSKLTDSSVWGEEYAREGRVAERAAGAVKPACAHQHGERKRQRTGDMVGFG